MVDNICVTIPIKEFRPTRKVAGLGDGLQLRVSMRFVAYRLRLGYTWNSNNDFEASVTEPSGNRQGLGIKLSPTCGLGNGDKRGGYMFSKGFSW